MNAAFCQFLVSALGINQEFIDATENELKRVSQRNQIDIQILRIRVITKAALLKWQNHIEKRRQLQKLKNELSADYQPSKEFFKLNMLRKTPRPLRNINMQAEFAFHELPYHPLTEIIRK